MWLSKAAGKHDDEMLKHDRKGKVQLSTEFMGHGKQVLDMLP